MICEGCAMQLSAANLLVAAQQIARPAQPQPGGTGFAAALAGEKPGFEALPIQRREPAPAQNGTAAPKAAIGSTIDIRV
jgi:hypothetical protein